MGTNRTACLAAVAVICLGMNAAATAAVDRNSQSRPLGDLQQLTAMEKYLARVEAAIAAVEGGAASGQVADALAALVEDTLFGSLARAQQGLLLSSAALVAWRREEPARARDLFLAATAADGDNPDHWYRLAVLELELGDRARSARYLTSFAQRWPELVDNLDAQFLGGHVYAGEAASTVRHALLQALFDANWSDRQNGVADVWRELALSHLANGNLSAAATAIARIDEPLVIAKLRSDARFDPLAERVAALPSVEEAAARRVDALRKHVADAPARIDLAVSLGTALLVAGRHEEALAASNATLAAIAVSKENSAFEHLDDQVWIHNNRAIALRRLGRIDEAVAALDRASRLGEAGAPNVSQVLNLGTAYCHLARPQEALETIARVGSMSGYGRMVQTAVEHCAALQSGDREGARKALAYLLDHRRDSQEIVLEALLREGRVDDAAKALIDQLREPEGRDAALAFVQEFRRGPELAGSRGVRLHWRTLVARDDVRAAVARVGRIGRHDVYEISGID